MFGDTFKLERNLNRQCSSALNNMNDKRSFEAMFKSATDGIKRDKVKPSKGK